MREELLDLMPGHVILTSAKEVSGQLFLTLKVYISIKKAIESVKREKGKKGRRNE